MNNRRTSSIDTSPRFCLQVCKCVLSLQVKIPNPDVSCPVVAETEFVPDIFEIRIANKPACRSQDHSLFAQKVSKQSLLSNATWDEFSFTLANFTLCLALLAEKLMDFNFIH